MAGNDVGISLARHWEVALGAELSVQVAPIPSGFECPLTLEIMHDPVMTVDGQVYERHAIENWLRHKHNSPTTNKHLPSLQLTALTPLAKAIETYLQHRPEISRTIQDHSSVNSAAATLQRELCEKQSELADTEERVEQLMRQLDEKDRLIRHLCAQQADPAIPPLESNVVRPSAGGATTGQASVDEHSSQEVIIESIAPASAKTRKKKTKKKQIEKRDDDDDIALSEGRRLSLKDQMCNLCKGTLQVGPVNSNDDEPGLNALIKSSCLPYLLSMLLMNDDDDMLGLRVGAIHSIYKLVRHSMFGFVDGKLEITSACKYICREIVNYDGNGMSLLTMQLKKVDGVRTVDVTTAWIMIETLCMINVVLMMGCGEKGMFWTGMRDDKVVQDLARDMERRLKEAADADLFVECRRIQVVQELMKQLRSLDT